MTLLRICTLLTVTPEGMEPIEIPWPPVQLLPSKIMFEPLLIARQSSWLMTILFLMVTLLAETVSSEL